MEQHLRRPPDRFDQSAAWTKGTGFDRVGSEPAGGAARGVVAASWPRGYSGAALDDVHASRRAARPLRPVRSRPVGQPAVQHDEGARPPPRAGRADRPRPVRGAAWGRVARSGCRRRRSPRPARSAAAAGRGGPPGSAHRQPLSSVASSSANQKPDHRIGFGPEEGGVLVAGDLAADAGLLEDVHRLQQATGRRARGRRRPRRARAVRLKRVEHRVEVVHARGRSC